MDRSDRRLHAVDAADARRDEPDPTRHALATRQWTSMLLDDEWRIQWVSPDLQAFLGTSDPDELGIGHHVAEALLLPAFARTIDEPSMARILQDVGPYFLGDMRARGVPLEDVLPAGLVPLAEQLESSTPPAVFGSEFAYVHPDGVEELGGYVVKMLLVRTQEASGGTGWTVLFDIDVGPQLVSLLARGDTTMYERMARLVQPGRQPAAILFCDLAGSTTLSRRLPTAEYFRLIRRLWTAIDGAVADGCGIVGKHAGDGASAFFLAGDLGGDSQAARAAIATARTIHELSAEIFRDVTEGDCLMKVGVHWGASLYMGQLVPGGRLDVTALGDEVNEAARIQEAASGDTTLASKQLIERLAAEDATDLGLAPDDITYQLLEEVAPDRPKVVRDAGAVAVAPV